MKSNKTQVATSRVKEPRNHTEGVDNEWVRWIDNATYLPPDGLPVLVVIEDRSLITAPYVTVCQYSSESDSFWPLIEGERFFHTECVTYWQQYPTTSGLPFKYREKQS